VLVHGAGVRAKVGGGRRGHGQGGGVGGGLGGHFLIGDVLESGGFLFACLFVCLFVCFVVDDGLKLNLLGVGL